MAIDTRSYRIPEGKKVNLSKRPTRVHPVYKSKQNYRDLLHRHVRQLSELEQLHYAHDTYSLLLIFQAMDAAGKDGTIKHVMSGINPQGCQVFSFKHPSAKELNHDFLWRTTQNLPERGHIGIFNRSYYEEVLIVRVHPELLTSEKLPTELADSRSIWKNRYHSIVELEEHLYRSGTRILKFFLHLSKEEQRQRFLKRIDDPRRNWKFSQGDIVERQFWDQYMSAYEECLSATSTKHAPWYVIPADDKRTARLIVSRVVVDTMKGLKMDYPKLTEAQKNEMQVIRQKLADEGT